MNKNESLITLQDAANYDERRAARELAKELLDLDLE